MYSTKLEHLRTVFRSHYVSYSFSLTTNSCLFRTNVAIGIDFNFIALLVSFFIFRFFDIFKPFPINLFEKLPSKEFFRARKKIKTGDLLSIKDLTSNLEALNDKRTDKVDSINQYTVRGGVVDFYSGFQSHPIRVDFFDNEIDEIREFDPSTQHMIRKLTQFQFLELIS